MREIGGFEDTMNYKLIAFDLDGTLLDEEKHVPEENNLALREAAERGVLLVPATGRILRGIPEEVLRLPSLRYFILSNGAAVYDAQERRTVARGDIPLDLTLRIMEFLDTQPVLYDCYQNDMGYMSRDMFERMEPYFVNEPQFLKLMHVLRVPVPDLKQTLRERGEPVQKIQFFYRPEDSERRLEMLRDFSAYFPEICATASVSNNVELNSVHAGKGNALRALCAALGIDTAQTLAFGDGINDISLLQSAGRGVAMANAQEAVKAAADAVCESNEAAGVGKEVRRAMEGLV